MSTAASGDSRTVVVLSDLHANGRAVTRALELARAGPMDDLVILGDLLTYGVDVRDVLGAVAKAQADHGARLVLGNHDQLYLDLAKGERRYYDGLPDWLRESVDLTLSMLDVSALRDTLVWEDEVIFGDVLLTHANPYGPRDWRYLNSAEDHVAAGARLASRGLFAGVFGHTHRAKAVEVWPDGTSRELWSAGSVSRSPGGPCVLLNSGSVGQPRSVSGGSSILRLTLAPGELAYEIVSVDYDVAGHVADLQKAKLSAPTLERLSSYFRS